MSDSRQFEIIARSNTGEARCPVCACLVEYEPYYCPRCKAVYHRECWEYNEGCAIFGCTVTAPAARRDEAGDGGHRRPGLYQRAKRAASSQDWREEVLFIRRLPLLPPALLSGMLFVITGAVSAYLSLLRVNVGYEPGPGLKCLILAALITAVASTLFFILQVWLRSIELIDRDAGIDLVSIGRLEEKLKKNPGNLNVIEELALRYLAGQEPGKARDLYTRALEIEPGSRKFRMRLAQAYSRLGDREGMIEEIDRIISAGEDDDVLQLALSWKERLVKEDGKSVVAVHKDRAPGISRQSGTGDANDEG